MEGKRDYAFEAFVEVTGAELGSLTQNERGRINRALAELRELEEDDYLLADLIHARAKAWKIVYPEIALTPQALTGSWSSIEDKADAELQRRVTRPINAPTPPQALRCLTCQGDKLILFSIRPSSVNPTSGFEEMVPCPDCNAGADTSFFRADGSRFRTPDVDIVRTRIGR
jgi:hypothetical protein